MGKSSGGSIAINIANMNDMVDKLFLCCPETNKLVARKGLEIYLSWNQNDNVQPITIAYKLMDDMNKQGIEYKFFSYSSGDTN